jgi:hypothetical protein
MYTKKYYSYQCGIYEIQKNEDTPNSIESMSQSFLKLLNHQRPLQYEMIKMFNQINTGQHQRPKWDTLLTFEDALQSLANNVKKSEEKLELLRYISFMPESMGAFKYILSGVEILPIIKIINADENSYLHIKNMDAFKNGGGYVKSYIDNLHVDETCQMYENYDDALTGLLSKFGDK